MPVKGRVSHERKLCKLLHEDTGLFATRTGGTAMPWADMHLYRSRRGGVWAECVIVEVKSSVKKTKRFYGREMEQMADYIGVALQYDIPIFYAYRWVTHEKGDERVKWRFFEVRSIEKYRLVWGEGLTYGEFLEMLA